MVLLKVLVPAMVWLVLRSTKFWVVEPVPPLAMARVPPRVRVPLVVMVPPVTVRPVVPPERATLVTVPLLLAPVELSWPYSSMTTVWGERPPRVAPRMPAM